jgi:hypothetical protein
MSGVKLTAKWQLDAALLSRPVDLTALVTMSRSDPECFLSKSNSSSADDDTSKSHVLLRLVTSLLNEKNPKKSDKDTKLDVLNILANVATGSKNALGEVRDALQGVSEWFDEYMTSEESAESGGEPELNKAMVLLLARCWEYRLKTEDVLELTQGNRKIALCTVVGLLEDGETYSTELIQRQKPGQGKMGQWEHELVCHRYEKPLLLQICRLLRGFTHPGTYFETSEGKELTLYSVEEFAIEMDTLLEITLRSHLVEKLSMALYNCLFELERDDDEQEGKGGDEDEMPLEEFDHTAVASVHAFLQNLYFYAQNTEEYRQHLLMETLLIPRLILPYLDRTVIHATVLNTRAEAYADMLEGDCVAEMALHNPQLVKGMSASLRTLIIASFRAPTTQFIMNLLKRFNPTSQILRATAFCRHHDYIFALLCMLNVNMGALDLSSAENIEQDDNFATQLLKQLASVYNSMDTAKQARVHKRLMFSGALPISRDTPSYVAIISVLSGGAAGQLDYSGGSGGMSDTMNCTQSFLNEEIAFSDSRAEAKRAHAERMKNLRNSDNNKENVAQESAEPKQSAFKIAVSVANAAESKGHTAYKHEDVERSCKEIDANKYRLLGDLPSLGPDKYTQKKNVEIALSMNLSENKTPKMALKADSKDSRNSAIKADPSIPKEFLCAINGHAMKEPMKSNSSGLVFEAATILLWIKTNGSVCPITHAHLEKADLVPDNDLRNRIKRYHIQQTSQRSAASYDDDLYDF